jgi:hypothetical protein
MCLILYYHSLTMRWTTENPGKTVFNPTWEYKYDWVKAVANDKRQAMCRLCEEKTIYWALWGKVC